MMNTLTKVLKNHNLMYIWAKQSKTLTIGLSCTQIHVFFNNFKTIVTYTKGADQKSAKVILLETTYVQ